MMQTAAGVDLGRASGFKLICLSSACKQSPPATFRDGSFIAAGYDADLMKCEVLRD